MAAIADHALYREADTAHASRRRGLYTSLDIAGLIAATIMALGPLTAFTVGL